MELVEPNVTPTHKHNHITNDTHKVGGGAGGGAGREREGGKTHVPVSLDIKRKANNKNKREKNIKCGQKLLHRLLQVLLHYYTQH